MSGLTWAGNVQAQRQAEQAYAKLKPKRKKRNRKQRRQDNGGQLKNHFARPRYDEYMLSKAWGRKRLQKMHSVGWKCERCGRKQKLQVHHLHYRTLGRERNKDLQVLCKICHEEHHLAEVFGVSHESLEKFLFNRNPYEVGD